MGGVRTSILERPRRLASHRLAGPSAERHHALSPEERDIEVLVLAVRRLDTHLMGAMQKSTHH